MFQSADCELILKVENLDTDQTPTASQTGSGSMLNKTGKKKKKMTIVIYLFSFPCRVHMYLNTLNKQTM